MSWKVCARTHIDKESSETMCCDAATEDFWRVHMLDIINTSLAHWLCQTHRACALTNIQRSETRGMINMSVAEKIEDSEADRLSGMSRKHRIHSGFYWFTEFCNSQCLSHFAAPFISVQAKTFITEGCKEVHRDSESQKTNEDIKWESAWQKK